MIKFFKQFFGPVPLAIVLAAMPCAAQQPISAAATEGDFVIHNFQFHSGESLQELRLHYTTLGKPVKDAAGHTTNAVLILHGTGGTGQQFFAPQFAGVLFGPASFWIRRAILLFFPTASAMANRPSPVMACTHTFHNTTTTTWLRRTIGSSAKGSA